METPGNLHCLIMGMGHAQESLVGDSLTLGDTTYVFSSNTSVTIHTSNGTTTSEYTYLRNGSANAVLSIGSSIMELKFYSGVDMAGLKVEGLDIFGYYQIGKRRGGYGTITTLGPILTICRTGTTRYFLSMMIMRAIWPITRYGIINGIFLRN